MKEFDITSLNALLAFPKNIVLLPHRSPDGDAMGSSLGMFHFLEKLNHNVTVIAPNDFPDFLAWMPGTDKVLIFEKNKLKTTQILQEADLVFTLDFNALHRVGEMEDVLKNLTVPFVMIDHHQCPDDYALYTFSDTNYGSTCEMVYDFILNLKKEALLDKNIATCLYTGILTDSGGFKFPKTTGKTHRIVAKLIELGAENTQIPILLFDNNSFDRLKLMGKALQNMEVLTEYKTSYMVVSQNDLNTCNYQKGDTEGFVNYGLTIKGIDLAAIFIENQDEKCIKISFRSQGSFDVNQFAKTYFNGGGHINAAGGKSTLSLSETVAKFKTILIQNHP